MSQSGPSTLTSKQMWGPLLLVFFPILGPALWLCLSWIDHVNRFQAARCPSDTFMVGSRFPVLLGILEFFFAAGLSGSVVLLFLRLFPAIPRNFDRYQATSEKIYFHDFQKGFGFFAALFGVSMLYVAPAHLLRQYCLATNGIYIQDNAFDHLQRRPWVDVSTVKTKCFYSKGWGTAMYLGFRDGKVINLNREASERWPESLPKVANALHGYDFKFDASGISPNCQAPEAAMLRTRP